MKNHLDQLVYIANLYYEQRLSQSEIAQIVGISRPTVSRMLEEARQTGIVEIIVHDPIRKNMNLSTILREKYNLKEAIVVSGNSKFDIAAERCGRVTAQLISNILDNNMSIGFSWGRAVRAVCNAISPKEYYNVTVAQMAGCLSEKSSQFDGLELAIDVARKLNAKYSNIISPVYVELETLQQALLASKQVKQAIEIASHLDIAFSGIGTVNDKNGSLISSDCSTPEERDEVIRNGAVAHILARLIDKDGNEVLFPNHYPISAPLDAMKNATWSIGISVTKEKAEATLAVINGGYINCLVCDEPLAFELLKLSNFKS